MAPQVIDKAGDILSPQLDPAAGNALKMPLPVFLIPARLRTPFAILTLRLQTVRAALIGPKE
jgi:hypothetical protein